MTGKHSSYHHKGKVAWNKGTKGIKRNHKKRHCNIKGCESQHHGLGYCHKHYQRFKKTGVAYA